MPKFYMWCGVDDFLIEQNREMNQTLKELDYDYVYKEAEEITAGNTGMSDPGYSELDRPDPKGGRLIWHICR